MTGQFYFALLNPAIAVVFAVTFLALWRNSRSSLYLLLLAFAFLATGAAFAANDFLAQYEGPMLRIVVNLCFLIAVTSACASAIIRVGSPVPVASFAVISAISAVVFCWFLFIDPSIEARIYAVNGGYAAIAVITVLALVRARPKSMVDWLFIVVIALLLILSLGRPLATLFDALDVNMGGVIQDSDYWVTVQALTPLLALAVALTFLAGLAIQLVRELRSEADRDYLTGLLNRRGFDKGVSTALKAEISDNGAPAVMLADIDDFKRINDTFGHATGDKVIIAVANVFARHGHADLSSRTGGEEFALFYRQSRRGDLLARADIVRTELSRMRVDDLPEDYPITVSIGIHSRYQAETLSEMMSRADSALYRAKTTGKDRVEIASPPLRSVANGQSAKG